jgi:hypothetical protein
LAGSTSIIKDTAVRYFSEYDGAKSAVSLDKAITPAIFHENYLMTSTPHRLGPVA